MPATCPMSPAKCGISNFRCKYPNIIKDFGFLHLKLRFFTRTPLSRQSILEPVILDVKNQPIIIYNTSCARGIMEAEIG